MRAKRSPSEAETQSSRKRCGSSPAKVKQGMQDRQALGGAVIAGLVMAFADMAAQHQHAIRALVEGAHHQFGGNPPRARHPDGTDIRRGFYPGNASRVCARCRSTRCTGRR